MPEAQLTSYEEVPYGSKPLYPTHPDCLATVATLMGMQPAAVENCRVLEMGCATGGNLIPMAATLPHSQFVGIDLSPRQIAEGQKLVDALGLTNIRLAPVSILDVDDAFGQFDYIICHGVYSWVPSAVQDKILEICSRNLAPQGVAYVSYNTYPGWHARGMVREMMGFHAKRFDDPSVRVGQARAFLEFVAKGVTEPDTAYASACCAKKPKCCDPRPTTICSTSIWKMSISHSTFTNSPIDWPPGNYSIWAKPGSIRIPPSSRRMFGRPCSNCRRT